MQITLSEEEAGTLRSLLTDYLPELRRERAHTDLPARDLRHELVKREELVERLVAELGRSPAKPA